MVESAHHVAFLAARVAKWLKLLIFGPLNHLSSHSCNLSLACVLCETSQVLFADGQVVFLGDLPFLPHLTIDSAQNECNNLDRP